MTPDQLERMAKWLAYLEPEHFRLSINGSRLIADNTELFDVSSSKIWVDQDRLFGACFRAAIARGWSPSLNTCDDLKTFYAQIENGNPRKNTRWAENTGEAMALGLLEAHKCFYWASQDPEVEL